MRRFREIFSLEMKALVRSKALALLCLASVAWMLAVPKVMHGDGTAEGMHELFVRFSLGGVFVLTVVSLLASATGSIARERTQKRLQLTLVRPVSALAVVLGKTAAHVTAGAFVLCLAAGILAAACECARPCNHVCAPILPSPRAEAEKMYEVYLRDPQTPDAVRKASRETVLRLLERRAVDHFQSVPTNGSARWTFDAPRTDRRLSVRLRFTNQYEMRQIAVGTFVTGTCRGTVSNITQAVVTVPLSAGVPGRTLCFVNKGSTALMLRPRQDLHLLVPADSFGANLVRTLIALIAIMTLVLAGGVFLSAGLSRPVAVFVAFVTLILGEMSPSVLEQYPDELETGMGDRIGLILTRAAAEVTHPVSAVSPLESLSKDECIEISALCRIVLVDSFLLPLVLMVAAAFVLPRRLEDDA